MNINQLVNDFIGKKETYTELSLTNVWAAHLIALAIRHPKMSETISEALKGEGVPQKARKPTVFLDVSPKDKTKVEGCQGCEAAKKAMVLGKIQETKKEAALETVASVMGSYPTREELTRTALQLGLTVHHKAKEETIAQQITTKLNENPEKNK